jgi:hypothetical protein
MKANRLQKQSHGSRDPARLKRLWRYQINIQMKSDVFTVEELQLWFSGL